MPLALRFRRLPRSETNRKGWWRRAPTQTSQNGKAEPDGGDRGRPSKKETFRRVVPYRHVYRFDHGNPRLMFNMGSYLAKLGVELRDGLDLQRAVETGTFRGDTSVAFARIFPEVVTIELAPALHAAASERFARQAPNVRALQGDSGKVLRELPRISRGTLFFLDGHWSTGPTAGKHRECPIMEELAAIAAGHADDCIIIDDARLFAAAPPPPHDPTQWPTLMEIFDALRAQYPDHYVTLVTDQVIAVPQRAKSSIDGYAHETYSWAGSARQLIQRASIKARMALSR